MKFHTYIWIASYIIVTGSFLLSSNTALAFEDDEGCLLCHKYPKLGRITDEGARRSYYVIPHVFEQTVHRNVTCTDCHKNIKQLPHREVKVGVTCNAECHSVKNPATGKNFSHKAIYEKYKLSTHGREKVAKGYDQDKPYCVTCHTNPLYNPSEAREGLPKRIIDRCVVCHEKRDFVESWYRHTSRRIKEIKRSSEEIITLCSSCHGDKRLVERHMKAAKLEGRELGRKYPYAVESYKRSFHGKVNHYGFNKAANCLDCHADNKNYFQSVHEIRPSRDPLSPVSMERRVETCKRCHTYADENFAQIDPHSTRDPKDNYFGFWAEVVYSWISYIVIAGLLGLALLETLGRRRDGASWVLRYGSSWWRKSKRGRDRKV